MKYKVWGALLCLGVLVIALAAPLLERQSPSMRYHQHRDAPAKTMEVGKSGFCTHLPLVESIPKGSRSRVNHAIVMMEAITIPQQQTAANGFLRK